MDSKELVSFITDVMPELGDIDLSKSIVNDYGINSVSIIRIIVEAEGKYGIKFSDYELALDSYETFGDFAAVIKEKLEKKEEEV